MSRNNKKSIYLLAVCMLLTGCQGNSVTQEEMNEELILPQQANYRTVSAEMADYVKTGKSAGSVEYPVRVKLAAQKDDSRLREVLVSKGDEVKQGDILAILETEENAVELEELRVALTRAEENLIKGQTSRQSDIQDAREEAEEYSDYKLRMAELQIEKEQIAFEQFVYQTEFEIEQLKKQIGELEEEAQKNILTAPFDGIIDGVGDFKTGDLVDKDDVLVSMFSPETFQVEVTDAIGSLRYNADVTITTSSTDGEKEYSGVVVSAPNILPGELSQESIWIRFNEDVEFKKTWGNLYCSYDTEQLQNILLVDKGAVDREEGKVYVYVLDGDAVQKRFVMVGLSNMESYWVLDGLEEGQSVILD